MKFSNHFKIKVWKATVGFCLLALVFNLSLVKAEEVSDPVSDGSGTTVLYFDDTPAEAMAVSGSGSAENPAETPVVGEDGTVAGEKIINENQASEPLISDAEADPVQIDGEGTIIFDFSQPQIVDTSEPVCGDGFLETSEVCDDGNLADGDGCSSDCLSEDAFTRQFTTGVVRSLGINQLTILAQWQMSDEKENENYLGKDNSAEAGGQFLPSGRYQVDKPLVICALAARTDGLADTNSLKANINYPENVAAGKDEAGNKLGCGQLKNELSLNKLNQDQSGRLVCGDIRNNNNNLIAWNLSPEEKIAYNFEQICGQEGYLAKNQAAVFCGQAALSYKDPAGQYKVIVEAQDNGGVNNIFENTFNYLELTTFENDFTSIQYGPTKQNEIKILAGDLAWGEGTGPTISNNGNTRLQIKIWQNDFGLGKTDGAWNIAYQARAGDNPDFINYEPEQTTALKDIIDLGVTTKMDFSVLIKRFPEANSDSNFAGSMTLSADKAEPLSCE